MKKRLFVFLICTIFILNSISAEAQPEEASTVAELPGYPVQFTEETDHIELNNTMFVLRFFKDTAGYNEILSKNGTFLVYEDNINLQYFNGNKWKNRGEPINISWVQVSDYWWNVSRFYDDYEGTTYTVTYVVRADAAVKISIEINSGQTDEYRVYWYPSGIVLTEWINETTKLTFGDELELDNWIAFDWFDVYASFGNITASGVEDHAQGKKAEIWFNIGEIQENETVVIDPSTVGTSTYGAAIQRHFQRKSFYAQGRFWVFYHTGSNMVFKTSTDGSSWSSATTITGTSGIDPMRFAVWTNTTHMVYAAGESDDKLYFRQGELETDGTITWDAAEQLVAGPTPAYDYGGTSICMDTDDRVYLTALTYYSDIYWTVRFFKNDNLDGTWSTSSGFPINVTSHGYVIPSCSLPLTAGKIYILYGKRNDKLYGKLYDGSLGSEETASTSTAQYISNWAVIGGVGVDDDVYAVFSTKTDYHIKSVKRTYGTGWGSEVAVQDSTTSTTTPVLSKNIVNDDLYCFWMGSPTANHVYYKKYDGSWDADPTDWITEVELTGNDNLNCFYESASSYIGVVYLNSTSSPYDVRFGFLTLGELFQRGVTLALTTSWAGTRVLILPRSATLTLTTSWSADRVLIFPRGVTLTLTTSWAGTRQVNYFAAPVLTLVTSWVATWPVPEVGLDFTLFALLLIIPLGVGVVSLKLLLIVSMLCGFFLFIYGAWLGANPYLVTAYHFRTATQTWITNTEALPFTPWPQVIICLCGIMLIAASMGGMLRE